MALPASGEANRFAYAQLSRLVKSDRSKGTPWVEAERFLAQHRDVSKQKNYDSAAWLQRANELVKRHRGEAEAEAQPAKPRAGSAEQEKASNRPEEAEKPKASASAKAEAYDDVKFKRRKEYEWNKDGYKKLPVERGTGDYGRNGLGKFSYGLFDEKAMLGASKFSTGGLGVAEDNPKYKQLIMGLRFMAVQGFRPAVDFFKAFPEYSYEKKLAEGSNSQYEENKAFEPLYGILRGRVHDTWNKPAQQGDGSEYAKGIYGNAPKSINQLGIAIRNAYRDAVNKGWGSNIENFKPVPENLPYETTKVDVAKAMQNDAKVDTSSNAVDMSQALGKTGVKVYDTSTGKFAIQYMSDRGATARGYGESGHPSDVDATSIPDFTADAEGNVEKTNNPQQDTAAQIIPWSPDWVSPQGMVSVPSGSRELTTTAQPAAPGGTAPQTPEPAPAPEPTPEPKPTPADTGEKKQQQQRIKGPNGFLARVAAILHPTSGPMSSGDASGSGGGAGQSGQHGTSSFGAPSVGSASAPQARGARGALPSASTGARSAPGANRIEQRTGTGGAGGAFGASEGGGISANRHGSQEDGALPPGGSDGTISVGGTSQVPQTGGTGVASGGNADPIALAAADMLASESPEDAIAKARQDLSGMSAEQIGQAYQQALEDFMKANGVRTFKEGLPAFQQWLGYDYYSFIDAVLKG